MNASEYVDIAAICRICIAQRGFIHVFETEDNSKSPHNSVADRIMSLAHVEVQKDDGLPDKICQSCLAEIDQAYNLKAQCEYADTTLRQLCSEGEIANNVVCFLGAGNMDDAEENLLDSTPGFIAADMASVVVHHPVEPNTAEVCLKLDQTLKIERESIIGNEANVATLTAANKENNRISMPQKVVEGERCNEDEMSSVSRKALKHMRQRIKVSVCPDCGEQFTNKRRLEAHAASHLGHKPFLCELCGKSFRRLSNLKEHERRHNGMKSFLCSNCGQFAVGKKNHYCTVVHDKLNKSFSCDVCQKKFVSKTTLVTHKKRHESNSKFQCSECNKLYFSRQELERHMRVHFNIRPFECPQEDCSLTFYSQGELNRHVRYHDGIKKFSCDLCGQKFFESGHLANHQRKHTGERPYSCRHCSKTFLDSSKLRRHSLIHLEPFAKRKKRVTPARNHEKYIVDFEEALQRSDNSKVHQLEVNL